MPRLPIPVGRRSGVASTAMAWGLALVLMTTCAVRGLGLDHRTVEIEVAAVAPLSLLLSWPLGVFAAVQRRWYLLALAVLLVACDVSWEGPPVWPFRTASAAASSPAQWRLFDANVAQNNDQLAGIGAEITRLQPLVITLEELTPPALASLVATGALRSYHWSAVDPRLGPDGMAVWSRAPLGDIHIYTVGAPQLGMDMSVQISMHTVVHLDVVHVEAPIGVGEPAGWLAQMADVSHRLAHEPHPLVVSGDFNATADLAPFRRLLGLGLADAAVLAGKGWQMTWPRNQAWVVPYLRIDHVLISSGLTVTGYQLGDGRGSDHHPVVVDIARSKP